MQLSESDIRFIRKRRALTASWKWVGVLLLLMLAGIAAWIWVRSPYMIDPWHVASSLEAGSIPEETLQFSAMLLPVTVLFLFVVMMLVLLLAFAASANERRLLTIIQRQLANAGRSET